MNAVASNFRCKIRFFPANFRSFRKLSLYSRAAPEISRARKSTVFGGACRSRVKFTNTELKENWLESLSCPLCDTSKLPVEETEQLQGDCSSNWIIGIDPDLRGALALLKEDASGCTAQVFDTPYLQVLIGKRTRKQLDARSIVQLLHSFGAPSGTRAYIEQSRPFPQDGKQGWWSGGFTYGLWIGILVASGFTVVPVSSQLWKDQFQLCRSSSSKDDSRNAASILFPSVSCLLKRKKDHGRAEALLIAAYGKGLKLQSEVSIASDNGHMGSPPFPV